MTKQETATIPAGRPRRVTRFSGSRGSNNPRDNLENSGDNVHPRLDKKSVPVSRLPIRSNHIYQNEVDFDTGKSSDNVHEACKQECSQLKERIMSLELLTDRLQAEVDEHRRVNIELLKTCQHLRYAQMNN